MIRIMPEGHRTAYGLNFYPLSERVGVRIRIPWGDCDLGFVVRFRPKIWPWLVVKWDRIPPLELFQPE